jgi:CRISPR-associated protein Cas2
MNVFLMVCYDVADNRRRIRVSSELENFGSRVQKSVFECHLDESHVEDLKERIEKEIRPDQDRVRYYRLCPKDREAILRDGNAPETKDWDYQIV